MYYNLKKIKNNFIKQIAKTKINKEKTNKTQLPQQNKKPQKQNKHKRVFCELASYPGHGAYTGVWLVYQLMDTQLEKQIFLWSEGINCNQLLGYGWDFISTSTLLRILSL